MLKNPKHFWNLHESTFIILPHHSEWKWFGKNIPYWNLKSYRSFLTHWLPMTGILLGIVGICSSVFKWYDLKDQTLFSPFFSLFWNVHHTLNILKKRSSSSLMYFRNYRLSKFWLDRSLNSVVSEDPSTFNMLKSPKHLWNLHESTFIIFFSHSEDKMIPKISPLLKFEILRLFLKTLAADDTYAVWVYADLQFPIQMQLSEKRETFLFHLWNLHQYLNILKKKMMVIANVFLRLPTVKDLVRPLSEKRRFRTSFDSQHVKVTQNLWNLHESTFIIFLITIRANALENISLIEIWNLRCVC